MTILYEQDWEDYPDAVLQLNTKNKSFLRHAALMKEMGIKNHNFILALHDPDLLDVDPHDYANLTPELLMKIVWECKNNFWYFIREIVRVPGSTTANPIYFRANRGNIAAYWLYLNHITFFLIQPRQTGKSFSIDQIPAHILNISGKKYKFNLLTKDDTLRQTNLVRLKNIIEELPFYLRQKGPRDVANGEKIIVSSLQNIYEGHVPNKSPKAAELVGRGLTGASFQTDEIAFIYNLMITLRAALPSTIAARELAEMSGQPYGNIFTTTAGKKDDPDGKYAYERLSESAVFTEGLFDCVDVDDLHNKILASSPKRQLRVNCTFSHTQLGYSRKWLMDALSETGSTGEAADRDYFNVWTSGGISSPLSTEISSRIRQSEKKDFYPEFFDGHPYILRWYIPESERPRRLASSFFVAAMDTSEAAGDDDIGLVLRDIKTGEVVCVGQFNETNILNFCHWFASLFVKIPNFVFIPERRSTGGAILDCLCLMLPSMGVNPFKRIFNLHVNNYIEDPESFKEMQKMTQYNLSGVTEYISKHKKSFGFATSGSGMAARSKLYGRTLLDAAKTTCDTVHDVTLVNQILGLVIRNGRVDHPDGDHDDICIAWLLSFWFMREAKNLEFYGIDSRIILSENKEHIDVNDPKKLLLNKQQLLYKTEIEKCVNELRVSNNEWVVYKLESRLRQLADKLNDEDKKSLSLDQLINQLKETRETYNRLYS
jgi:hypothetical protein